jgi:hypothetical protein
MGVINATQNKPGTIVTSGPIGRFVGWIESLFGHTPTVAGEPSRGNDGELEMTHDFGHDGQTGESNLMEFGWDKTGGWDKRKKSGWSPHGDGGMK